MSAGPNSCGSKRGELHRIAEDRQTQAQWLTAQLRWLGNRGGGRRAPVYHHTNEDRPTPGGAPRALRT
jgi:hypothetical protein